MDEVATAEALVLASSDAIERGAWDTVAEQLDPDVVWHATDLGDLSGTYRGRDAVIAALRAQRELASIDVSDVAADGEAEVSGFGFTTPNTTSVMVSVKTKAECQREHITTHGMVVVNGGQITELGSIGTPRLF